MQDGDKIIKFISDKKNRLIKKVQKELETLIKLDFYRIAEDIYHTFAVMDFSDKELDMLISHEGILRELAIEIQNSDMYDELIDGTINRFLGRR